MKGDTLKNLGLLFGGVLAAVAASSCCILPLLLGAASAGTVGLGAALTPYRPYLTGLTVLLLGAAFYFTYRPGKGACGPDGSCAVEKPTGAKRAGRALLWGVTVFTVAMMAYPEIAARRVATSSTPEASAASLPEKSETAVFAVGNMSCAECTPSITKALKSTPGVFDATVSFEEKKATVRYAPSRVNLATLKSAIEGTGFPVTEVGKG